MSQHLNMASNHPTRTIHPAQKLNEDNIGTLQLASHRNFVKAAKETSSLTSPNEEPSTQGSVADSVPESDAQHQQNHLTTTMSLNHRRLKIN